MIKLKEAVIVEGKYDKIKLDSILDCIIIQTNGFGIYKDKEKLELIRSLAQKNGIIIMTDSDKAGFQIRNYLKGAVPNGTIKNVYIPNILGKEKRKIKPSSQGMLGVEGVCINTILEALKNAGVDTDISEVPIRPITKADLYEDGLSGSTNSHVKRSALLKKLGLPSGISANSMPDILNTMIDYETYKQLAEEC